MSYLTKIVSGPLVSGDNKYAAYDRMCKTFFFNMKILTRDFRNYVQYDSALCRMTYTQMIAYTDFVTICSLCICTRLSILFFPLWTDLGWDLGADYI